ncbi:ABC transporter permease subunit [Parvibaculum sedimenti]|uniref:ABC transporter permease subunit n=1 Tax=Parvibaculum sedimenti TaxID=2608632 RepID=A0A6N6VNB6_9HYPH|nr:ABC transporter permease subunit [Parvibaculum sedimenti]KAB7742712.1 ABC transporter permease subunit [Parvibaculum sedimenti]
MRRSSGQGWRSLVLPAIFIGPLILFVLSFLILPALQLLLSAFSDETGHFTLSYLEGLADSGAAFENSILLSGASALLGTIVGGITAYLVCSGENSARSFVRAFSAVAANFAGVPLAFAFVATLGSLGMITLWFKQAGLDIYRLGFSLYGLPGLILVYAYFQIPLMLIVITPAIEGLRKEWREAAEGLGATPLQYWRMVGLPILMPSLASAFVLLFGNAFSAYATPYALTSGALSLVPIEISNVLSGNVMLAPQTGAALAIGMIVVMGLVMLFHLLASRRLKRWTGR